MRRPSIYSNRRSSLELKMTPMIDVIFLLLVFFVWTASFQIVEQVLPSTLSAVSGSQPADITQPPPPEADFDEIVVRIQQSDGRPQWLVNDTPLATLAEVKTKLTNIAAIKRDAPVILHPDKNVPLGEVIDVWDISRIAGFEKVQFAASEDI